MIDDRYFELSGAANCFDYGRFLTFDSLVKCCELNNLEPTDIVLYYNHCGERPLMDITDYTDTWMDFTYLDNTVIIDEGYHFKLELETYPVIMNWIKFKLYQLSMMLTHVNYL